ncbi:MAG: tRNA (cytidine(34)-2'-O)-methyltransferase [Myxococcota bacterium]
MLHVVLVTPQIPQNTGNISRLTAGTGATLHLVGELGFSLEDRYLKRAGLDYWPHVRLERHATLEECLADAPPEAVAFYSTHAERLYTEFDPPEEAWFVFGREADGLPDEVLEAERARSYRIPVAPYVRSLNLSNAVAVVLYEAFRRRGFPFDTGG